jgi:predicted HTH domain antitoxin
MYGQSNYTESEMKFYESIGLLVAREVTAEKAAEISGYTFNTYMELLRKMNIHPYIYDSKDFETDLATIEKSTQPA